MLVANFLRLDSSSFTNFFQGLIEGRVLQSSRVEEEVTEASSEVDGPRPFELFSPFIAYCISFDRLAHRFEAFFEALSVQSTVSAV
jgi:hypothetical protein